jgi:GNAT superfamily N-acetyltransferase
MSQELHIDRLGSPSAEAFALLLEYFEAVQVVVRDTYWTLANSIADPQSGFWIASIGNELAGCVLLRPLPAIANAAECKRLYVRPFARGLGVATALMNCLEVYAIAQGYTAIYLDTKDDLKAARSLYAARGYEVCERYNDNPQATVFLRKRLASSLT